MAQLVQEAEALAGKHQPKEALGKALQAQSAGRKAQDVKLQVKALCVIVDAHLDRESLGDATKYAEEALGLAQQLPRDAATMAGAWLAVAKARVAAAKFGVPTENPLKPAEEAISLFLDAEDKSGESSAMSLGAEALVMQGSTAEGLELAKVALKNFRDLGVQERGRIAALEAVISAHLARFTPKLALHAAKEELEIYKKSDYKEGQAAAMQIIIGIRQNIGDDKEALRTAKEALKIVRTLDDNRNLARLLLKVAELHFATGNITEATAASKEALSFFDAGGLIRGREDVKRLQSKMLAQRGQVAEAPNRSDASLALEDLASAVEGRQAGAFKDALKRLSDSEAFTEQDVENALAPVFASDQKGAMDFLKENEYTLAGGSSMKFRSAEKNQFYVNFRLGGLGYGPKFQCPRAWGRQWGRHETLLGHSVAALKIHEDSEDWEQKLPFHPGICDGALQSGSAGALGDPDLDQRLALK